MVSIVSTDLKKQGIWTGTNIKTNFFAEFIYSIFFIVHMLEDKMTEHYLKTHILKDEYMEKFRHIYFNDSL
jgi:hypothetical protein